MVRFKRKILDLGASIKENLGKISKLQQFKKIAESQKECIYNYDLGFVGYMSVKDYRNSFGMLTGMKVHLTNLIAELDECKELGCDLIKEEDFCRQKRASIEFYEKMVEKESNMMNPFVEPCGWKKN